ncbi:helix-turn-helix transcriptional regulator [Sediminitomix flava]|uniref:AraC-like DNA-binding protein n=1 Tax=Sediminitomix flava TaxID=379075 RepID=A0A316A2L5_SEDFL|nr:helix-turn-helix domain-containing protein [Sediminitomix flava]PWJ43947.1 AraC-like DNA-binding protein [Sediminitomix flava]
MSSKPSKNTDTKEEKVSKIEIRSIPFSEQNWLDAFAQILDEKVENGKVQIPKTIGTGYLESLYHDDLMSIISIKINLKKDIIWHRLPCPDKSRYLIDFFRTDHLQGASINQDYNSKIQEGAFYLNPSTSLEFQNKKGTSIELIMVGLEHKWIEQYFPDILEESQDFLTVEQPYLAYESSGPKMKQLFNEFNKPAIEKEVSAQYFRAKCMEVFCLTYSYLKKRIQFRLRGIKEQELQTVFEIRNTLSENLEYPYTLKGLSLEYGMNKDYMNSLFEKVFAISIPNYLKKERMELAKYLLEKNYSVKEVAIKLGYSESQHFTRAFKTYFQILPKTYQINFHNK